MQRRNFIPMGNGGRSFWNMHGGWNEGRSGGVEGRLTPNLSCERQMVGMAGTLAPVSIKSGGSPPPPPHLPQLVLNGCCGEKGWWICVTCLSRIGSPHFFQLATHFRLSWKLTNVDFKQFAQKIILKNSETLRKALLWYVLGFGGCEAVMEKRRKSSSLNCIKENTGKKINKLVSLLIKYNLNWLYTRDNLKIQQY